MGDRPGLASVNLGETKEIALRLVASGRFGNVSEVCRAGLRRLERDEVFVNRIVELAEEGIASGIAEDFNFDTFIAEIDTSR